MINYFICGIGHNGDYNRLWGYFSSLEKAKQCVEENWTDLWECNYYPYTVIEPVEEGIITNDDPNTYIWYHWEGKDYEDGDYKPCDEPEFAKGICGWGIS